MLLQAFTASSFSMKYFIWLFLLIPPLLSLKCERDCFPSKEPELKVIFSQANPSFQRVYGLGGNGNISRRDGYYYLPVSLRTDSITYIFEQPPRTDTLTIFYSRNFFYESERCGYEVELLEREVHTTFTQASVRFSNREGIVESSKYEVFIKQ